MLSRFFAAVVLAGVACSFSTLAEESDAMLEERIGDLGLGLSEDAVEQALQCRAERGPEELWGADGAYHQEWIYADCGITLDMVSEAEGAAKSVASVSVSSPSLLGTTRGIRIGSTRADVEKAYRRWWNAEESDAATFVAGSIYGGLIFGFEDDKVAGMFLGAAAE